MEKSLVILDVPHIGMKEVEPMIKERKGNEPLQP